MVKSVLRPLVSERKPSTVAAAVIALLVLSAALLFLAPLAMPESYSWTINVISESAGQGVERAWIARLGFLLFGVAVAWLTVTRRRTWPRGTYWMQMAFALFMLGTAAFAHRPFEPGVPFDATEDFLHSLTATGMGFAFTFGVLVRFLARDSSDRWLRGFDLVAMLSATGVPVLILSVPEAGGLFQRVMFAISYLWFGSEASLLHRTTD